VSAHPHMAPATVASGAMNTPSFSSSSSSGGARIATHTQLTYSRQRLVALAKETIQVSKVGYYTNHKGEIVHVKEALDRAVDNCVHYPHDFNFKAAMSKLDDERSGLDAFSEERGSNVSSSLLTMSPSQRFPRTSFIVVSASWLQAASELSKACGANIRGTSTQVPRERGTVGVLNSASATTPGGRFLKGTVSQEDCLCRASLLYACISQPKFQSDSRFYGKNRSFRYGSSNCVIFSPDVPVIREDSCEGKLLDKFEQFSFVSTPAPNAFTTNQSGDKEYNDPQEGQKGLGSHKRSLSVCDLTAIDTDTDFDAQYDHKRETLLEILSDRITRALSAFALGGCTDLVLPAFGCGVHGNDPVMVATVFRELLTDPSHFGGRFRTVVFAIPPSRKNNYQAFASYFQKNG